MSDDQHRPNPTDRREHFEYPLLTLPHVTGAVAEALDHAAATRRGVLVTGPKGLGKSEGLRDAERQFAAREREAHQRDPRHRVRGILSIPLLKATQYREALGLLLQRVLGMPPALRVRGQAKSDDELRVELVQHCLTQNLVAFAIDDGERLSAACLDLLRDVMTEAEARDQRRDGVASGAAPSGAAPLAAATTGDGQDEAPGQNVPTGGGPPAGRPGSAQSVRRAAGIGVLVVGAPALANALTGGDEAGQRWAMHVELGHVPGSQIPEVYRAWFPGFAPHIEAVGLPAWRRFFREQITGRRTVTMRAIENHAWAYFRAVPWAGAGPLTREQVPFDEAVFLRTWAAVNWGNADGRGSDSHGPAGRKA